jgi:hypothetical protein
MTFYKTLRLGISKLDNEALVKEQQQVSW